MIEPRRPFDWEAEARRLPPLREDIIALARGAVGGIGVIAALMFINYALPLLRDWILS